MGLHVFQHLSIALLAQHGMEMDASPQSLNVLQKRRGMELCAIQVQTLALRVLFGVEIFAFILEFRFTHAFQATSGMAYAAFKEDSSKYVLLAPFSMEYPA